MDADHAQAAAREGLEHRRRLGPDVQPVSLAWSRRSRVEGQETVGRVERDRGRTGLGFDLGQHAGGAALGEALTQRAQGGGGEGQGAERRSLLQRAEPLPLSSQAEVDKGRRDHRQRDLQGERLFPAHELMLRQAGGGFNRVEGLAEREPAVQPPLGTVRRRLSTTPPGSLCCRLDPS